MRNLTFGLGLIVALFATDVASQERALVGRLRFVEGSVVVQRASEAGSDEARNNDPFLPGDRLWTTESGRAEIQFTDGSLLRLDSRSKLDFDSAGDRGDRATLKIWSGSAILRRVPARGALDFIFTTPDGVVSVSTDGRYRIDVDASETRVNVLEGRAVVDMSGRRHQVDAGERATLRDGELRGIGVADAGSEFDDWADDRDRDSRSTGASRAYLPEDVLPYEDEFDAYGTWASADEGYVWRPHVAASWSPYTDGRWVWTDYGWTWVPYESWGWAASHYGRWGHSFALGWYWIPTSGWGPAWVSWAVNDDYVGWCPLGRRDIPVRHGDRRFDRGHAVPRNSQAASGLDGAWVFAQRSEMARRDGGRARWTRPTGQLANLQVFGAQTTRLGRDLRPHPASERAIGRINRTPGDVVPELKDNPMYLPLPRRTPVRDDSAVRDGRGGARGRSDAAPSRDNESDAGRGWRSRPVPTQDEGEVRRPSSRRGDVESQPMIVAPGRPRPDRDDGDRSASPRRGESESQPFIVSPRRQRSQDDDRDRTASPRRGEGESQPIIVAPLRPRPERVEREREQDRDSGRDILRRFFRPTEEGRRRDGGGDGDRGNGRPRDGERRDSERSIGGGQRGRPEQHAEGNRGESRRGEGAKAAPRPPKDKDNHRQ